MRKHWLLALAMGLTLLLSLVAMAEDDARALSGSFASPSEMYEYRSLDSYGEAPSLAALVAEGTLPPVEERLPEEPFVWKSTMMLDGLGVYGDLMRHSRGSEPECWANMLGCYSAWEAGSGYMNEGLVNVALEWLLTSPEALPNLAKSWEWSEDGYTLTMHLMKGVKWSDGVEFTANDVLFTYNDIILNPNVPSLQSAESWTFGGKVTELEKIDDYTIAWHFGASFPVRALALLDGKNYAPIAAHVYKYYHPDYNPVMTYDDLLNSASADTLPAVVIGAFVPVHYEPGSVTVYVRNPYYYKVDEAGNQLPYFDAAVWIQDSDWSMRNYRMLTGEIDQAPVQDAQLTRLIYAASLDEKAPFTFQWGPFTQGFSLHLNYSLHLGVQDARDLELRTMFRTLEFRQALAYAIDREAIAEGIFGAPNVGAYYGGYPSGSPYYRGELVTKYEYNPAKAEALLAGLGFTDTNGDGILNWPAGTAIAGEELSMEIITASTNPDHVALAEGVQPFFAAVGIDLKVRLISEALLAEKEDLGEFDIDLGPSYSANPDIRPESLGSVSQSTPWWHKSGPNGERELLGFEQQISDLLQASFTMFDADERTAAFEAILPIFTEQVASVPLIEIAYALTYSNRHRGYPSDMPVYLYDWFHQNLPIEITWAPTELQLSTAQYLEYLATPDTYAAQPWYHPVSD